MNGPTLQVQMLGQFTLRYGDRTISDSDDRSRRVWSLLAYMIYNHGRSFAQEELIHLYWSNGEKSAVRMRSNQSFTAFVPRWINCSRDLAACSSAAKQDDTSGTTLYRFPSILRTSRRIFMPPKLPKMTMSVWQSIRLHWHCMPAIRCRA